MAPFWIDLHLDDKTIKLLIEYYPLTDEDGKLYRLRWSHSRYHSDPETIWGKEVIGLAYL